MTAVLPFKKTLVDLALAAKLEAGVIDLSRLTGESFHLAKAMFGRLIVASINELTFALVTTHSRPSKITFIAVDNTGITYLPSIRVEDFKKINILLNLSEQDSESLRKLAVGEMDDLR